jgi:cystathionine beta-lyase/cystathionine gamma-synthase
MGVSVTLESSAFTRAVHAGAKPEPVTGAIMTPVFMTSTFVQSEPGVHKGFDYSRAGNPTRDAYEAALVALEAGAKHAFAFASGLAAEQAIVQLVPPRSRVVVCDDVYGGTGRLFRRLYAQYEIDFVFVDMTKEDELKGAIDAKTKLVWVETPSNPTMKIIDVRRVVQLAKAVGAHVVVDNTFASPLFQSPLKLGADLVVHSTTKYIGGHSDLIGGAVMCADDKLAEQLRFIQFAAGAVPSPLECFLLHRSVKTLAVRMQQHERNALAIAEFLAGHKKVRKVHYPGLPRDPGHALAKSQMSGFSGIVTFEHAGRYDDVVGFLKKLRVFSLAESLGGVESLVNHPEKMTHASVPEDLRRKLGIGPTLIRLSCGIESTDDLVDDLKRALD